MTTVHVSSKTLEQMTKLKYERGIICCPWKMKMV